MDVSLANGGVFQGQILNAQGAPMSGVNVAVRNAQADVATTVTDRDGKFILRDVSAGVHHVMIGPSVQVVRFWAPEAAPPSAKPGLLVVADEQTVRGKDGKDGGKGAFEGARCWWQDLSPAGKVLIVGGVAAAIAIPIALAADDDGSP
jgi:hypothetical protein